jgi:hypothetical protein
MSGGKVSEAMTIFIGLFAGFGASFKLELSLEETSSEGIASF